MLIVPSNLIVGMVKAWKRIYPCAVVILDGYLAIHSNTYSLYSVLVLYSPHDVIFLLDYAYSYMANAKFTSVLTLKTLAGAFTTVGMGMALEMTQMRKVPPSTEYDHEPFTSFEGFTTKTWRRDDH